MNQTIRGVIRRLRADERGMTTVEYAIVLCLIAAVSVGTWANFGEKVEKHVDDAADEINDELKGAD